MPIFEYECADCGNVFEQLHLSSTVSAVECLHCGGVKVKKLYSAFAHSMSDAGSRASVPMPTAGPGCGRCGSSNPCSN